jgi:predicted ArsR family transcriptional regulator
MAMTDTTTLNADDFTDQLRRLTTTFGDETRRQIYFYIRSHPGATANILADEFGIHANVARHHLDRLEEAGYVENEERRSAGVGRPAKAFRVTDAPLELSGAMKRDALLVRLLERAMSLLGPDAAEAMALAVGEEYGREIAANLAGTSAQASAHSALAAVAEALTAHGFAARPESSESGESLVSNTCPFGDAAVHHPVLCAVDRGLVTGMLDALGAKSNKVTLSSRARGDDQCRTTF